MQIGRSSAWPLRRQVFDKQNAQSEIVMRGRVETLEMAVRRMIASADGARSSLRESRPKRDHEMAKASSRPPAKVGAWESFAFARRASNTAKVPKDFGR